MAGRRLITALVLVLAGCGADDGGGGPSVSVADLELGAVYRLSALSVDDAPVELVAPVAMTIDAEFGSLEVDTGCGVKLGSFSLLDDGRASFTVTGGSAQTCEPAAQDQERALLTALAEVDHWTATGSNLSLTTTDGSQLDLTR